MWWSLVEGIRLIENWKWKNARCLCELLEDWLKRGMDGGILQTHERHEQMKQQNDNEGKLKINE